MSQKPRYDREKVPRCRKTLSGMPSVSPEQSTTVHELAEWLRENICIYDAQVQDLVITAFIYIVMFFFDESDTSTIRDKSLDPEFGDSHDAASSVF